MARYAKELLRSLLRRDDVELVVIAPEGAVEAVVPSDCRPMGRIAFTGAAPSAGGCGSGIDSDASWRTRRSMWSTA